MVVTSFLTIWISDTSDIIMVQCNVSRPKQQQQTYKNNKQTKSKHTKTHKTNIKPKPQTKQHTKQKQPTKQTKKPKHTR